MIVLLIVALLVIAGASLPATRSIKKLKTLNQWDYIYPYTGIPLWFALTTIIKIGQTASLSNFVIENFWITVISIVTPWLIFLLYKAKNKSAEFIAKGLTLLPIVFTIVLRLLIKSLPE